MTRLHSVTKKIHKIILGIFLSFSFCHTSYFVTKMEKAVALFLKITLPSSYATGIKPLSLTRWHIDALGFKHPKIGRYEASDVFFDLKLWPLLLGKCHLESLVVKELHIFEDPTTPLDLNVFNSLYQNRFFLISKLHVFSLNAPLLPHNVSLNFTRKPNLNFLEIYDSQTASHAGFEIANHSPFLKFHSEIAVDLPHDSLISLSGYGSIKNTLNMDLNGFCGFSAEPAIHPLSVSLSFHDQLSLVGKLQSDNLSGDFYLNNHVINSHIICRHLEQLFPRSELYGDLDINIEGDLSSLKGFATSDKLYYRRKALAPLSISFPKLKSNSVSFEGSVKEHTKNQLSTKGLIIKEKKHLFSEVSITSNAIDAFIKGQISQNRLKDLSVEAKINDLGIFETLFEKLPMSGQGNLIFKYHAQNSALEIFSHFNNIKIGSYSADKSFLSFLSEENVGHLKLELGRVSSPFMEPFSIHINAEKSSFWDGISQFKNKHCDIKSSFAFEKKPKLHSLKIEDISGIMSSHSLTLSNPFEIKNQEGLLTISPFSLKSANMSIGVDFKKNHKHIAIENLPLNGFKIPYFDSNLEGSLSCLLDINDGKDSQFEIDIQSFRLKDTSSCFSPLFLHATASHNPENQTLGYSFNTYFSNDDFFFSQGSIPLNIQDAQKMIWLQKPSHHFVNFKYDLKDLGRILNMGTSSIGGKIFGDLYLHGNLQDLSTFGNVRAEHLHAGFPFLGIFLDQGCLEIKPLGKEAEFSLKISDLDSGQGVCQGHLDLNDFSYKAKCHLEKVFVCFKNIFSTKASGIAFAEGSFSHIKAQGDLKLEKSIYELSHPEIKKQLSYKIEKLAKDLPTKPKSSFKYDLNFDLNTQDTCKIKGIGIDSDWDGQSQCRIANSIFSLKGTLICKKGEYKFNTKKFNIDEGVIHLEDSGPSTILAKGTLEIPSYQIKVNLIGPLNAPTLNFSSLPNLSENAIFSYILFNKPISELHPFQSIELAQTLMELSGDKSPVSLSKIRSNLSIDALDIRTSDYDQNKISLHVGKYITPSFLIGLNQTTNASDVLLQLELKHGFILKAESQEQKDGKLSFKWRKSF
jgi:TamB, inner membrane protein subunit of TAM complex